jgi:hypothetical protein
MWAQFSGPGYSRTWLDQPGASRFVLTHLWWLPLVLIGGAVAFISGGATMREPAVFEQALAARDRVFTWSPV